MKYNSKNYFENYVKKILEEEYFLRKKMILKEFISFGRKLELGVTGDDVKNIQSILGLEKTGNFDEDLKDCVIQFQNFSDIDETGIVDDLTKSKLGQLLTNDLKNWQGCKKRNKTENKTNVEKSDSSSSVGVENVTNSDITGSDWKSCKQWVNSGGLVKWGNKIQIQRSASNFIITYKGPSYGLSIAHAANGKDTIHQIFNVLICEINPYLALRKLKPKIDEIDFQTSKDGKDYFLKINVPLLSSSKTYQLNRRGGWGHDPGPNKMLDKLKERRQKNKETYGPVRKIIDGPFGKIREYFITYEI